MPPNHRHYSQVPAHLMRWNGVIGAAPTDIEDALAVGLAEYSETI